MVQYLGVLGADIEVARNDQVTIEDILTLQPEKIVISPGPGTPDEAGICKEVISRFSGSIPILGVCLGHQCIGQLFGFLVVPAKELVHGKTSPIYHTGEGIFTGIPQGIKATRYHSLVLERSHTPKDLKIIASTQDKTVMAVQHLSYTFGNQFHPESVATEYGLDLLKNFMAL